MCQGVLGSGADTGSASGRLIVRPAWLWPSVALLSFGLLFGATEGWLRWTFAVALLVVPTAMVVGRSSRRRDRVALVAALGVVSAIISALFVVSSYGALLRAPVAGNSDQLDFTVMSWVFAEQGVLGITQGTPAREVLASAEQYPVSEPDRLQAWQERAEGPDETHAYSYRSPLYPLLLGSAWRLIGFEPQFAVVINLAMLSAAVMILAAALMRAASTAAGLVAGTALAVSPQVLHWSGQLMSETLTVLLCSVVVAATVHVWRRGSPGSLALLAIPLAGLALTKQSFLLVAFAALVTVTLLTLWRRRPQRARTAVALGVPALLLLAALVAPWLAYNVNNTGSWQLLTGTAGWHDMAASYSRAYLAGEDRVAIRERHFNTYERRNNVELESGSSRALVGRQMWWSQLKQGAYAFRLPALMAYKFLRSVPADAITWTLRLLAVCSTAVIIWWGSARQRWLLALLSVVPVLLITSIMLTIEAGPRLLVSWPVFVAAVCGLGVDAALSRRAAGPTSSHRGRGSGTAGGPSLRTGSVNATGQQESRTR